jgi:hypothetical protein
LQSCFQLKRGDFFFGFALSLPNKGELGKSFLFCLAQCAGSCAETLTSGDVMT